MSSGKPGDHPITGICVHRIRTYTDEIDELVRELVNRGFRGAVERELFAVSAFPNTDEMNSLLARLHSIQSGK